MNHFQVYYSTTPANVKIERFGALPEGWHYGDGGPISQDVIRLANKILDRFILLGLSHTDAFPGEGGEVLVAAYHGPHYVGVIVEPDGSFAIRYEEGDDEKSYEETDTLSRAVAIIRAVAEQIWSTYDYFIQPSSIAIGIDSATLASRSSATESQYSQGYVPRPMVA